mmetsp:Transcript_38259/g.80506  ORF Transcript_38259/g.80506 Transcript_38259/m.80506 type:complete len:302 (-) Transcript_38259:221-1126(-)|eukprot:CAMPEP_0183707878 /NCGR_PEP_ID=MMETSP0737-20130205/4305_1 /TAXON_ID=385413 /ORGANISM="Thalassiosira miniscula, Strain CCMP1093" /LENGTH=301 /DNA_ID=CAMNT_0025935611 /DNA_START=62 /DNA_END=967 /DNA_ORIENTATION=+
MHVMKERADCLIHSARNSKDKIDPPQKNKVAAHSKSIITPPESITIDVARKQSDASNTSRHIGLKLFRRASSVDRPVRASSYAGPMPMGLNGFPLRGCIKSSMASTLSVASDFSDQMSSSDQRSCSSGHRVSFSHVELREYCRQVGDNPSVSSGCPLSIGWKFNKRGKVDIDSYEADLDRDPVPCERLSAQEREKLLTEIGGASQSQIMQGRIQAYFDYKMRAETLEKIGGLRHYKTVGPRERLLIMKESAARKIDRARKGTSPLEEQRKLWDNAKEAARRSSAQPVRQGTAIAPRRRVSL